MTTIFVNGVPIKGEKIRNRKYVPKDYGEPCSCFGCKRQPTSRYTMLIFDEEKIVPMCFDDAKAHGLI